MIALKKQRWLVVTALATAGLLAALVVWRTHGERVLVSTRFVDGLGRPLPGATLEMCWTKATGTNAYITVKLAKMISDSEGVARGQYFASLVPTGEDVSCDVSKAGYSGYSTSLRPEFILKRIFQTPDIERIAKLEGEAQAGELREMLAGEFEGYKDKRDEIIFKQEDRFRVALRQLAGDRQAGAKAGRMLAVIGDPQDIRLFLAHAPPPKRVLFQDRWAYVVVSSLLDPVSEQEWDFLRRCLMDDYQDNWVRSGAIQSLKLIGSPRARTVLEEAGKLDPDVVEATQVALKYIDSGSPIPADRDLVQAGRKAARAVQIGKWWRNRAPRLNDKGDRALIECDFVAGRDLLEHTATFQRVDGVWKLRGARETMQALLDKAPTPDGEWEDK